MPEFDSKSRKSRIHPLLSLFLIILLVSLGFTLAPFLVFFIYLPFYGGTLNDLSQSVADPLHHPELKIFIYLVQGASTLIGLILVPAWLVSQQKSSLKDFFRHHRFEWIPVLVTVFTVIIFMAVNSVFVEWNAHVHFPEFAREFENWARETEDARMEITESLTKFGSPVELIIAFIVIAVLPAIGEEIVFRGLIQNELFRAVKNIHVSIWLSAILFSAMHIQFFGFVPRMLLGALFGYLYYWSGNLSLAIIAHFVNNGLAVLALYLYQQGTFDFDPDTTEAAPAQVVMISAVLTAGLLYYFYKYFEHRKPPISLS